MKKPISSAWDCTSEKTNEYRLLNMIHAMCGSNPEFSISETATFPDYLKTIWTNGIVDVTAITTSRNGVVVLHEYLMVESDK